MSTCSVSDLTVQQTKRRPPSATCPPSHHQMKKQEATAQPGQQLYCLYVCMFVWSVYSRHDYSMFVTSTTGVQSVSHVHSMPLLLLLLLMLVTIEEEWRDQTSPCTHHLPLCPQSYRHTDSWTCHLSPVCNHAGCFTVSSKCTSYLCSVYLLSTPTVVLAACCQSLGGVGSV